MYRTRPSAANYVFASSFTVPFFGGNPFQNLEISAQVTFTFFVVTLSFFFPIPSQVVALFFEMGSQSLAQTAEQ